MSTLTVDLFSSLDGFGGAEGWPGYYGKEGPELMAWLEDKPTEDHVLVMGANTYRTMSRIVGDQDDPTFARMAEIPQGRVLQDPGAAADLGQHRAGH